MSISGISFTSMTFFKVSRPRPTDVRIRNHPIASECDEYISSGDVFGKRAIGSLSSGVWLPRQNGTEAQMSSTNCWILNCESDSICDTSRPCVALDHDAKPNTALCSFIRADRNEFQTRHIQRLLYEWTQFQ